MKRRELIILLGGLAIWSGAAPAQPPDRVRRIGILMGIADDFEGQTRIAVFRQALQGLGWIEGRNVQLIYRWSAGDAVQAQQFAKELLDLRSDVILVNSTPVASAVKDTVRRTPTVFVQVSDPVAAGVVQSLPRPAGSITGFTNFDPSIASKWLELLKRVAPNITRVAYLFNPNTAPLLFARAVENAAPSLSIKPFAAAVHDADEIERVIKQIARESDSALLVLPDLFTATNRESIIARKCSILIGRPRPMSIVSSRVKNQAICRSSSPPSLSSSSTSPPPKRSVSTFRRCCSRAPTR